MGKISGARQQGIALPVMMIILLVMLVGSVYLLKASNSSTMTAANLAYDSSLSKSADVALHRAFQYLHDRAKINRTLLQANDPAAGYMANYDRGITPSDPAFWTNAQTVTISASEKVDYIIYRSCSMAGSYDATGNSCVQTSANPLAGGTPVAAGDSLDAGTVVYNSAPQIHYIITARISGPRGGNVVNQMVVLIDA